MDFVGTGRRLADADVVAEAQKLGCEPAAVWAVCDVESAGRGFLPDDRPTILFEAHVFGKLTGHRWDHLYPNISAPAWNRQLYGPAGAHQYDRLAQAIELDRTAALESASWGLFQILGANFAVCGFASVEDWIAAICESEEQHLDAFGEFCRKHALDRLLRTQDWTRFALGYNGPGEADNDYDEKLEIAYVRRAASAAVASNQSPPTVIKGPLATRSMAKRMTPKSRISSEDVAEALNREELGQLR